MEAAWCHWLWEKWMSNISLRSCSWKRSWTEDVAEDVAEAEEGGTLNMKHEEDEAEKGAIGGEIKMEFALTGVDFFSVSVRNFGGFVIGTSILS